MSVIRCPHCGEKIRLVAEKSGRGTWSRKPHPRREEAVQLVRDGATHGEAARTVGVSTCSVGAWCRAAGVTSRRAPRRDPDRDRAMVERVRAGETFTAIGEDYGISRERVRQIANRNGVTGEAGKAVRKRRVIQKRTNPCAECGTPFVSSKGSRYCSRECRTMGWRGPKVATSRVGPDGLAMRRHPSGHWTIRAEGRRHDVRVERAMVQKALGRPLKRDEWVRLLDGDPDNLSPENIAMMSPTEAHKMRGGMFAKANRNRTPSYTTLAAILRNGGHDE